MQTSTLVALDPSWNLRQGTLWPQVAGLTALDYPRDDHLVLVKNKIFLNRLKAVMESFHPWPKMGLVLEEDFWPQMAAESDLIEQFSLVATVKSIPHFVLATSYSFYQESMLPWVENFFSSTDVKTNIDPTAKVSSKAVVSPQAVIGQQVVIEDDVRIFPNVTIMPKSYIGRGTWIFPNVTIYPRVLIGKNCRIHGGTVIGGDGFGYQFEGGAHQKIWHSGGVVMEDNIEIGANTTVDAGTFSPTIIRSGTKIDNLVQVAHNCQLGEGVLMCGQAGIAGSVHLDNYVVMGGKAGSAPDVHIGLGAQIAGSAMVSNDVAAGAQMAGHPARPLKEWLRSLAYLRRQSQQNKEG